MCIRDRNGTDMSELKTDNRYKEYTYDFYVGFSRNMGERFSFSASITGEYYKTARYHAWAAYPTAEDVYKRQVYIKPAVREYVRKIPC